MAFALKCDICRKYFEYIQDKENKIRICHVPFMKGTGRAETYDEYDTCPDCLNSVYSLITTLKMNGGEKQTEGGGNNDDELEQ